MRVRYLPLNAGRQVPSFIASSQTPLRQSHLVILMNSRTKSYKIEDFLYHHRIQLKCVEKMQGQETMSTL